MTTLKNRWPIRVGYGLCSTSDIAVYDLFYIYFLFFLTDIVGINPLHAGIIMAAGVIWDAIDDPFIGSFSDNTTTKKGRRLPWMKFSVIPVGIMIYLMFQTFDFAYSWMQLVYFSIVVLLLKTFYTMYVIPFFALAPEITTDYNERNILRFFSMYWGYMLLVLVSSGPMWIWAWADGRGYDDTTAWAIVGAVFGIGSIVVSGIGLFLVRNSEKDSIKRIVEARKTEVKQAMFKVWAKCLKIKVYRKVLVWIAIYIAGYTMINTVLVYLMTHSVGMTEMQQGTFWVLYVIITAVALPVLTVFCNKYGRRPTMLACMIPAIFSGFVFWFTGIDSVVAMYVYAIFTIISSCTFFTWYVSYAFDCIEILELKTGERYEGAMTSLATMAQKIGSAVAMVFTGWYLGFVGYNEEVYEYGGQTARAISGIVDLGTLFPSLVFIVSCLLLFAYPISKKKYELLCQALECKKAGKEYSTEGFEDILQ